MEQQAKERLTGGVILVVLLVLLVPELLTGPRPVLPPAPAQPDQAPMRSYTMDLGPAARVNSGPVAASTPVGPAAVASEPAAISSAPAATRQAPPGIRTTPLKPLPGLARTPTAPGPAASHSARKVPSAPATPARGAATWTVQLGTFSSRQNAARLVASLKSHGFGASVSEATRNGHKLFRVRVGSERERAAAQKLQSRLRAAGQKGGEVVER